MNIRSFIAKIFTPDKLTRLKLYRLPVEIHSGSNAYPTPESALAKTIELLAQAGNGFRVDIKAKKCLRKRIIGWASSIFIKDDKFLIHIWYPRGYSPSVSIEEQRSNLPKTWRIAQYTGRKIIFEVDITDVEQIAVSLNLFLKTVYGGTEKYYIIAITACLFQGES